MLIFIRQLICSQNENSTNKTNENNSTLSKSIPLFVTGLGFGSYGMYKQYTQYQQNIQTIHRTNSNRLKSRISFINKFINTEQNENNIIIEKLQNQNDKFKNDTFKNINKQIVSVFNKKNKQLDTMKTELSKLQEKVKQATQNQQYIGNDINNLKQELKEIEKKKQEYNAPDNFKNNIFSITNDMQNYQIIQIAKNNIEQNSEEIKDKIKNLSQVLDNNITFNVELKIPISNAIEAEVNNLNKETNEFLDYFNNQEKILQSNKININDIVEIFNNLEVKDIKTESYNIKIKDIQNEIEQLFILDKIDILKSEILSFQKEILSESQMQILQPILEKIEDAKKQLNINHNEAVTIFNNAKKEFTKIQEKFQKKIAQNTINKINKSLEDMSKILSKDNINDAVHPEELQLQIQNYNNIKNKINCNITKVSKDMKLINLSNKESVDKISDQYNEIKKDKDIYDKIKKEISIKNNNLEEIEKIKATIESIQSKSQSATLEQEVNKVEYQLNQALDNVKQNIDQKKTLSSIKQKLEQIKINQQKEINIKNNNLEEIEKIKETIENIKSQSQSATLAQEVNKVEYQLNQALDNVNKNIDQKNTLSFIKQKLEQIKTNQKINMWTEQINNINNEIATIRTELDHKLYGTSDQIINVRNTIEDMKKNIKKTEKKISNYNGQIDDTPETNISNLTKNLDKLTQEYNKYKTYEKFKQAENNLSNVYSKIQFSLKEESLTEIINKYNKNKEQLQEVKLLIDNEETTNETDELLEQIIESSNPEKITTQAIQSVINHHSPKLQSKINDIQEKINSNSDIDFSKIKSTLNDNIQQINMLDNKNQYIYNVISEIKDINTQLDNLKQAQYVAIKKKYYDTLCAEVKNTKNSNYVESFKQIIEKLKTAVAKYNITITKNMTNSKVLEEYTLLLDKKQPILENKDVYAKLQKLLEIIISNSFDKTYYVINSELQLLSSQIVTIEKLYDIQKTNKNSLEKMDPIFKDLQVFNFTTEDKIQYEEYKAEYDELINKTNTMDVSLENQYEILSLSTNINIFKNTLVKFQSNAHLAVLMDKIYNTKNAHAMLPDINTILPVLSSIMEGNTLTDAEERMLDIYINIIYKIIKSTEDTYFINKLFEYAKTKCSKDSLAIQCGVIALTTQNYKEHQDIIANTLKKVFNNKKNYQELFKTQDPIAIINDELINLTNTLTTVFNNKQHYQKLLHTQDPITFINGELINRNKIIYKSQLMQTLIEYLIKYDIKECATGIDMGYKYHVKKMQYAASSDISYSDMLKKLYNFKKLIEKSKYSEEYKDTYKYILENITQCLESIEQPDDLDMNIVTKLIKSNEEKCRNGIKQAIKNYVQKSKYISKGRDLEIKLIDIKKLIKPLTTKVSKKLKKKDSYDTEYLLVLEKMYEANESVETSNDSCISRITDNDIEIIVNAMDKDQLSHEKYKNFYYAVKKYIKYNNKKSQKQIEEKKKFEGLSYLYDRAKTNIENMQNALINKLKNCSDNDQCKVAAIQDLLKYIDSSLKKYKNHYPGVVVSRYY